MLVTKKDLKNEIKDLKTLIKAFELVEFDLNEIDVKISLMNLIYRKSLDLINKTVEYLNGKNKLNEEFMSEIITYEDDINKYVNKISVLKAMAFIKGYIGL